MSPSVAVDGPLPLVRDTLVADDATGMRGYADETVGVRRCHAAPDPGGRQLALFTTRGVGSDHEGLAIDPTSDRTGYLLLSDQQGPRLQVFTREAPHRLLAAIPVRAHETDGIDVTRRGSARGSRRGSTSTIGGTSRS